MRVLLISNSQDSGVGVAPGESYPEVVQKRLAARVDFVPMVESGWTILDFLAHVDRVIEAEPDVVYCQLGIVECACRILSAREKDALAKIRGASRLTKLLHDHRRAVIIWRRRLGIVTRVMSPAEYRACALELKSRLEEVGIAVVFVDIPRFTQLYESTHFPFVNADIELFNSVTHELESVSLIEEEDEADELWQSGTVHFSQSGHELAGRRLADRVETYQRSASTFARPAAR